MRNNKRVFGNQIEIRCWDSKDARTASPTRLPFDVLEKIAAKITREMPEVVSVTYNIIKTDVHHRSGLSKKGHGGDFPEAGQSPQ